MNSLNQFSNIKFIGAGVIGLMLMGCLHEEDDEENVLPVADAGQMQTVMELSSVNLVGSGTDSDGMITSYMWQQTSGMSVELDDSTSANASFKAPVVDANEELVFQLTVIDDDGASATSSVNVLVENLSSYKLNIKVSNITYGQPLTPVAIVAHKTGYTAWSIGQAATNGLEKLAESGDVTDFIAEADSDSNVISTAIAGSGPFGPTASESVDVTLTENKGALLTIASMLANTNDAFAGSAQVSVGSLAVGDGMTLYSHVHDAGTEKNTEAAGTIAGPADVSTAADKGYSATRDDVHDFVTLHPGIVSNDDGLSTSVLNETHRWMGAAAKIEINRTQ